jgi:hypothetical protein
VVSDLERLALAAVDEDGNRLFPEEGPSGGCASGECLPDVEPASASPAPAPVSPAPPSPAPAAAAPVAAPPPPAAAPAVSVVNVRAPQPPPSLRAPEPPALLGPEPPPSVLAPEPPPIDDDPEDGPPAAPPSRPAASAPGPNSAGGSQVQQERWRAAVEKVKEASARHGKSLAFGRLLWMRPGEIAVGFSKADDFHRMTVTSGNSKALVEKALSEHFSQRTTLVVQNAPDLPAGSLPASLAEQDAQDRATHTKTTDAKVRTHPATRAVLKILGGELEHIQVFEKERPAAPSSAEGEPPDETP